MHIIYYYYYYYCYYYTIIIIWASSVPNWLHKQENHELTTCLMKLQYSEGSVESQKDIAKNL